MFEKWFRVFLERRDLELLCINIVKLEQFDPVLANSHHRKFCHQIDIIDTDRENAVLLDIEFHAATLMKIATRFVALKTAYDFKFWIRGKSTLCFESKFDNHPTARCKFKLSTIPVNHVIQKTFVPQILSPKSHPYQLIAWTSKRAAMRYY